MFRLSLSACSGRVSTLRPACALLLYRGDSTVAVTESDWASAKSYEEIPGPKPLPFIGNYWRFMPIIGEFYNKDFVEIQNDLFRKYSKGGKIVKLGGISGRKDWVLIYDPEYVKMGFRTEGPWPMRDTIKTIKHYRSELRKDFYQGTEGVILTQGKQWQDFRTKINQPMMQPRNAKLYVGPIDEVSEDFIARMRDIRNDKGELPKEFIQHLYRWALESISVIALDTRLGCLQPNLPKDSEPQKMIDNVKVMFEGMYQLDIVPRMRHFTKYKIWHDLVRTQDSFNEVAMKYIKQAMERIQKKEPNELQELSVLEQLLVQNENPMVACVMALDMMMAGIDTTSNAVAVLLHYLATNQDKQQKLFQELVEILPSKDQPITATNLEDMKYLKACLKESMRMNPIAPGNIRETVKDIVLGPYRIPKGKDILFCHMVMANNEEYFSQPDRFNPERWLKGNDVEHKKNPFVFMPFGFGPRMCVGRRFAELEIETLTAKVVRNFRLEYDQELKMKATALNQVVSPLNMKLEDRTT